MGNIKTFRDTAANLTSENRVLWDGEPAWAYDDPTKIVIGDGATARNDLISANRYGFVGSSQAKVNYGTGVDGALTLSSGTLTLAINTFYADGTISGTGSIITAGYFLYFNGTLDLTNAPAGAIKWNGNSPATPGANNGGTAGTVLTGLYTGGAVVGKAGAGGLSTAGASAAASNAAATSNGGSGGASGTGGSGWYSASSILYAGGAGIAGGLASGSCKFSHYSLSFLCGFTLIQGGAPGAAGSSGGGQGTTNGAGGGGGGPTGGGVLVLYARTISRGPSTSARAISVDGGTGGTGGSGNQVNGGSGSGAGGAGGGWLIVYYETLTGSVATSCLSASGGNGGNGGTCLTPTGTGIGQVTAGGGGNGGNGGNILLHCTLTGTSIHGVPNNGSAGTASVGTTPGTGGAGGTCLLDL